MVQLSHPYMTTGKIIALTIRTFVNKMMSLIFNMLSRFAIAFIPRSKPFDFKANRWNSDIVTFFLISVSEMIKVLRGGRQCILKWVSWTGSWLLRKPDTFSSNEHLKINTCLLGLFHEGTDSLIFSWRKGTKKPVLLLLFLNESVNYTDNTF